MSVGNGPRDTDQREYRDAPLRPEAEYVKRLEAERDQAQATIESLGERMEETLADYEAGNHDQMNGETWLVERLTDLRAALHPEQPQRCPTCHGKGTLATVASLTGQGVKIPCDACDGTGRVAPSG